MRDRMAQGHSFCAPSFYICGNFTAVSMMVLTMSFGSAVFRVHPVSLVNILASKEPFDSLGSVDSPNAMVTAQ